MKRTAITLAALVMAATANAKEWTSEVVTVKDGQVNIVETVKSCNYATTTKLARQVMEKHEGAYFNLKSADNEAACPKKTRKPKAE